MRSDEAIWAELSALLDENDGSYTVYGYRVDKFGQMIKPALFKSYAYSNLIEEIQRLYGAGDYKLLIRKGRVMAFSGTIALGPPPGGSWDSFFGRCRWVSPTKSPRDGCEPLISNRRDCLDRAVMASRTEYGY